MNKRNYAVRGNTGLSLNVIEWGPENGQPIVMLHGIRGYAETFANLAGALAPTYRTIAYDQRGRAGSDWDPERQYFVDSYVDDLDAVVQHLGLEQFDLLGHSLGGMVSIVYAARRPRQVKRLVIEDAGPGASNDSAGGERIRRELTTTPMTFPTWDAAVDFMRRLRPTVTAAAIEDRLHHMMKKSEDGWTWRYDHIGIAEARLSADPRNAVDLWSQVEKIACPTLVLRGGRSDYLQRETAAAMSARNVNIRWADVPDAGHYIHDDQPAAFVRLVADFLRSSA
ncbi:MAG: alpha/beta hydrolase [Proteobacteria bacterium]|nr:alpha/beta hydrolase [Pseudomonadota bacterium]